jgi:hypothetical protein
MQKQPLFQFPYSHCFKSVQQALLKNHTPSDNQPIRTLVFLLALKIVLFIF